MLTQAQKDALFMLSYLYTRLGDTGRARSILGGVAKACPDEPRTNKYLAAIAIYDEDYAEALALLEPYTNGAVLGTEDAPLLLMKAKALWQESRIEESRNTLDEYLYVVGAQS